MTTTRSKGHTPLPWAASMRGASKAIVGNASEWIAILPLARVDGYGLVMSSEVDDNGALILRAVNCHDELVAALKAMLANPDKASCKQARAALRKASED